MNAGCEFMERDVKDYNRTFPSPWSEEWMGVVERGTTKGFGRPWTNDSLSCRLRILFEPLMLHRVARSEPFVRVVRKELSQ